MNYIAKINEIHQRIMDGGELERSEALELIEMPDDEALLKALFSAAEAVKQNYNGNKFSLCSIMSGKHGSCSENCKFCAQSAHYNTGVETKPLEAYEDVLNMAKENEAAGVKRFSLVTSGKGLCGADFEKVVDYYDRLNQETELHLCASLGTIGHEEFLKLKQSGVQMYHHNLETSREYYDEICTTHSYQERVDTIIAAKKAGLKICSGGIIGMGESRADRISMLYDLKELGVDSIPVNILNPIEGTPLQNQEIMAPVEVLKTIAVYRLALPKVEIRYGGGRMHLGELQREGFRIGINGMIVGDYLTTVGNDIAEDRELLNSENLEVY